MKLKNYAEQLRNTIVPFVLLTILLVFSVQPAAGQSQDETGIQPLRSDVGINGITANFHPLGNLDYLGSDTLETDGSSELEIVFHNVRMMMPRLGVGYQLLASFFTDGPESDFGIGSWGLGPVVRGYPFETEQFQPYVEGNALFGNNMALNTLANTKKGGNGFRLRLGLRGGVAFRITNSFGFFIEGGPDWESSTFFKADARAWQVNVGIDVYRFN